MPASVRVPSIAASQKARHRSSGQLGFPERACRAAWPRAAGPPNAHLATPITSSPPDRSPPTEVQLLPRPDNRHGEALAQGGQIREREALPGFPLPSGLSYCPDDWPGTFPAASGTATAGASGVGSFAQSAGTQVSRPVLVNGALLKTPVALLTAPPAMDHITGMQPLPNRGQQRFTRVSDVLTSLKQAPSRFQVFSPKAYAVAYGLISML
jgi:hypothetical protein